MKPHPHLARRRPLPQRGSFLLESLIAVLIVALGVLGLLGLLGRSMQSVDDNKYRGEAAYLANGLIGQMWVSDRALLAAKFASGGAGAEYAEFKALVQQRLPNARDPDVLVGAGPTPTSRIVQITVWWQIPGSVDEHQHQATATIGMN